MRSFQATTQTNHNKSLLNNIPQSDPKAQEDFFSFLKNDEENQKKAISFFSEKGLCQDIIELTHAEPDICLEVFYALYNILWPQIQKQSDITIKDAWINFIESSMFKGILYPPEKLIDKKKLEEGIKCFLSDSEVENQVFQNLDQVVHSIVRLKQEIAEYDGEILLKKEILTSLDLVQEFYVGFRNKVKERIQMNALDDLLEPKAVMMSDIFTDHWAYRISRNKAQRLFSSRESCCPVKIDHVASLPEKTEASEPIVSFQASDRNLPIQPEKEFMLSSLYRCINIPVRESALLVLTNVCEENSDNFFIVQASEVVIGEPGLEIAKNPERNLEEEACSLQAIGALLTNPSGDSLKNFKYSPLYKTLISIDNSLNFKPEFIGDDGKTVNMKSVFLLLSFMDQPVSKFIRTYFTTLDSNLMILAWLQDLSKKNKEYEFLSKRFSFHQARNNGDMELSDNSFLPRIFVSKNLLNTLVDKLQKIERILLNSPSASIQALFEEVSPTLGKFYKRIRSKFNDPEAALEALWGQNQNQTETDIDYSHLSSLLNDEELMNNKSERIESGDLMEIYSPEKLFDDYKNLLVSQTQTPLDSLIRRHREKRRKNLLSLQDVLKELLLLIQEGLTDSKSIRSIVDFMYEISTMIHQSDDHQSFVKEINVLLSSLPHEELQWLLTVEKHFVRATHDVPSEKRTSSLTLYGAFMKQRIFVLTESEKRYLFDQLANYKKTSNHITFHPAFDLKQYPERPGNEFATILFMRLLGIAHVPYQDLLIINQHPVLLTQKVVGNPLPEVWQSPQAFKKLDPYHTGLLIISSILLSPENEKGCDFILKEDEKFLIPIDNDHNFLLSMFHKNLLFCLDEMNKSIPLEVKHRILSINFDDLFALWLRELIKIDDRYNNLVDSELQSQFLKQSTVLGICFPEQFIHTIYWKAHKIQEILRKGLEVTPLDLLKAVEPSLAKCYLESFKKDNTPRDRFPSVIETSSKGGRASLPNTMEIVNKSDLKGGRMSLPNPMKIINIPEQIGPVDALELLNELIKEKSLPEEEFSLRETDLENFFRNPKKVLILRGSKLIKNDKLEALLQLAPEKGARIRSISFQKSPLLTFAAIRTLVEGCPNIESLNVSECIKLDKIIIKEDEWPFLTRLEAQECPVLEKVICPSHHIQILKIGSSCKIEISIGGHFPDFVSIAMKTQFSLCFKKGKGFEITSANKRLSSQDFIFFGETMFDSYFKDLKIKIGEDKIFSCKDLGLLIKCIDLVGQEITNQEAQRIASLRSLERLNLSECVFMERGILNELIQGHWLNLKYLNLSMIELENEDFSILSLGKWPLLEELHLQRTKLEPTGIQMIVTSSNWPQLKHFNISFNEIHDEGLLILSRENWPPLLETLNLSLTRVTTKGLLKFLLNAKWSCLKQINFAPWEDANKTLVDSLLPMNWSFVEELNLSNCAVELKTIVSQPKYPQLKYLNLSCNEITEEGFSFLSLGEWPLLEELHLENTKLTSTGIKMIIEKSNWLKLKHLDISNNDGVSDDSIKLLSRGDWPQLETLNLSLIKATIRGLISFFLNINWPYLKQVIFMPEETTNQEIADQFLPSKWALVEKIDLRGVGIIGGEMKAIVEKSTKWPKLKYLDISNNDGISDEMIEVLPRGNWPLLEILDLRRTKVTTRGLLNLVLDINWLNLKEIIFALSDNLNKGLVNSLLPINWPSLQRLDLRNIGIGQSDIIKIVNKSKWTQLKYLVLSDNDIFDEGLRTLCQGSWPLLETLDLSRTKVTTRGLLNFLVNGNWTNLKGIAIEDFDMNDSCLISSLLPRHWPLLTRLNLTGLKITQEDINGIVKKAIWPRLKYLNLSDNDGGDKGLEILSQGNWPLLEKLYLVNTNFTIEGFEIMLKNANWPNLKELHLCPEKICFISKLVSEKWPQVELIVK